MGTQNKAMKIFENIGSNKATHRFFSNFPISNKIKKGFRENKEKTVLFGFALFGVLTVGSSTKFE